MLTASSSLEDGSRPGILTEFQDRVNDGHGALGPPLLPLPPRTAMAAPCPPSAAPTRLLQRDCSNETQKKLLPVISFGTSTPIYVSMVGATSANPPSAR